MFSRTVPLNSAGSCGTSPIEPRRSSKDSERTSIPSSVIRPVVTSQKRGMSKATVVFPAPLGPTSATTSPGAIANDTSHNTSGSSGP